MRGTFWYRCGMRRSNLRRHDLPQQSGFTLIEIMIVVVILGIAVGAATAIMRFSPQQEINQEVQRLWQLFSLIQDQARTQGHVYGWQLSGDQYQFKVFNVRDQRWFTLEESPLQPRTLNSEFTVEVKFTAASDKKKTSSLNQDAQAPDILFFPNGESTPFTLLINRRDDEMEKKSLSWLENDGITGIYLSTPDNRYHE